MVEGEQFTKYLQDMVKKIVKEESNVVTKEDAAVIIQEIIPELDRLIAKRIKEHFVFLAEKTKERFEE